MGTMNKLTKIVLSFLMVITCINFSTVQAEDGEEVNYSEPTTVETVSEDPANEVEQEVAQEEPAVEEEATVEEAPAEQPAEEAAPVEEPQQEEVAPEASEEAQVEEATPTPEEAASEEATVAAEPQQEEAATPEAQQEVQYPAFNATIEEQGVTLSASEGVFPEGTTVSATDKSDDDAVVNALEATISTANGENLQATGFVAYDFSFVDASGNKVEPKGDVSVTYSNISTTIPSSEVYRVYHVTDDGNVEAVEDSKVTVSDDQVTFTANSFSSYAVVGYNTIQAAVNAEGTENSDANTSEDNIALAGNETAYNIYHYALIPGQSMSSTENPNNSWFGLGVTAVTGVKDPSTLQTGIQTNFTYTFKNEVKALYPKITYGGKTYTYAEQGSANADKKGYYTLMPARVVVASGANAGNNNYNPTADGNTYHQDYTMVMNEKNIYTVTFNVQDPGETTFGVLNDYSQRVSAGTSSSTLKRPTSQVVPETKTDADGNKYTFDGWYTDENCTQKANFNGKVQQNTNYYGKYVAETYTVKYDTNGGTPETYDDQTLKYHDEINQPEPTKEDCEFLGWTFNGNVIDKNATYSSLVKDENTKTITLVAKWKVTNGGEAGYYLARDNVDWASKTKYEANWTNNPLKYRIKQLFRTNDTFTVDKVKPTASNATFIGWLNKRGGKDGSILTGGETVVYDYKKNSDGIYDDTYTLDALWATIKANNIDTTYDGKNHEVIVSTEINEESKLAEKYKEMALKKISYGKTVYKVNGKEVNELLFKDAGEYNVEVSKTLIVDGKENILKTTATVKITPATLKVTTQTDNKVYDGEPLKAAGSITGFVNGETAPFTTTGSQTEVGSSDNTYTIDWENGTAKQKNYTVSESLGKLTVTEYADEITVTTTGGKFTYNGQAHGATVAVSTLPKGYKLEKAESSASATDVTEEAVNATCDTLIIRNAKGEDVTAKLNVKKVDGTITVSPATLTVTTPTDNKVYDGEPLKAAGSITGFVNGETAPFTTTGSQTEVGSSDNTYTIDWENGTAKQKNYTVSESLGKLTVTENADEIVVTTTGGSFKYDGQAHGATVAVSTLPKGYKLDKAESNASVTDVTAEAVNATCDTLIIRNAKGEDVTAKLKIKKVDGTITVSPAILTVTTPTASKVYDGEPLKAAGSVEGFVEGEDAKITTTGSQTEVGSSDNTYELEWAENTKATNYIVVEKIGVLTVTEYADEITVTTTGGKFTYNGQAHGATVAVSTLPKGYKLEKAESSASATDVTEEAVNATCDTLIIRNAKGEDVTAKLNVKKVDGTITVSPATLTVTTPTDNKVYDGEPLKAAGSITGFVNGETAPFTTTGSQTEVGSSDNTYTIDWENGTAKQKNYTVSESLGKLTVTENADEIVVTTTGGTFKYDGQAHGATVTVSELPKGYTLDKAESNASVTDVTTEAVSATCDTLVIKNAQGEDVTAKLNVKKVDGTITVSPAILTVTTPTDNKVYDGEALTAEGSVEGFVNNETAEFITTGSQTEVGSSENTYTIDWNGTAKQKNYIVVEKIGVLTVTEYADEIVVTTTGGTFKYDGQAHGATVTVSELPEGYKLEKAESSASVTDVTEKAVNATCDTLIIRNAKGEDVTAKLNVKKVDGTITVSPAILTVTTPTASKVYDGEPLKAAGSVEGFVEGEDAKITTTGSQTEVGSSDNTYELEWAENTKATNYIVVEKIGVLTVTEQNITPEESGYLGVVINNPSDVVYDGLVHKWDPEVKTSENVKLKKNKDYEVTYDKDDFVNVTGVITVTITGKGNYEGTVTRTYQITPRSICFTSGTASRPYDGTPLTNENVSVSGDGFAKGEGATFAVTGTITNVGTKANTFGYALNKNTLASNYNISTELGTLTITPKKITPDQPGTPDDKKTGITVEKPGDVKYDGKDHAEKPVIKDEKTGVTLEEGKDYEIVYPEDIKNAGEITATVVGKGDYEGSFEIKFNILKRDVTFTSATDSKQYDGNALTNGNVEITGDGFIEGEGATFNVTGSITDVGSTNNAFTYAMNEGTNADNYNVTVVEGTLTVSEQPVVPTPVTPTTPSNNTPARTNNVPARAVTNPTTTTPAPEATVEPEKAETTPAPTAKPEKIKEEATPQAAPKGHWALINLIAAMLSVVLAVVALLAKHAKDEDDEGKDDQVVANENEDDDENESTRHRRWKVIATIDAILAVVVFILTENISLPMVLVDKWTLLMVLFGLISIVSTYFARKWHEEDEDEDEESSQNA